MNERKQCILCKGNLVEFYTIPNFPISMTPTEEDECVVSTQIYGACDKCNCVQMMNLIDPLILYKNNHNETYNTPTWKSHHIQFAEFIHTSGILNTDAFIEIGGNPAILYPLLGCKNYTIMNICDPETPSSLVKFIVGNCETYTFDRSSNLIMSHVFEHLYNPSKFVENIAVCEVDTVFISIPNMDALLDAGIPNCLNNEHTYFINDKLIRRLFGNNGYDCVRFEKFREHSYFFMFKKLSPPGGVISFNVDNDEISQRTKFLDIFKGLEKKLVYPNLPICENTFISPGGHYGQFTHHYLKPTSLVGFLDNDPSKQGKYVYGTGRRAFPFDILNKYHGQRVRVFLYACPYTKELRKQLEEYAVEVVEL